MASWNSRRYRKDHRRAGVSGRRGAATRRRDVSVGATRGGERDLLRACPCSRSRSRSRSCSCSTSRETGRGSGSSFGSSSARGVARAAGRVVVHTRAARRGLTPRTAVSSFIIGTFRHGWIFGYSAPRAPRSANIRHVMTHRASRALATPPRPSGFHLATRRRLARSRRSSPTRAFSPLLADSSSPAASSSSPAASSSLVRPPLQPLSSKECPSALRPHSARPRAPSSISPPYPSLYFCATR